MLAGQQRLDPHAFVAAVDQVAVGEGFTREVDMIAADLADHHAHVADRDLGQRHFLDEDQPGVSDLPRRILERSSRRQPAQTLVVEARPSARFEERSMNLRRELEKLERAALTEALRRSAGNPARAAELLSEVGRGAAQDPAGTVRAMMRRLGITSGARL